MTVSVILVNFRGTDDTITALNELGKLDWPSERLELIVVENASGDDSAARILAAAPHVRVIESAENLGFSGGCNLGAEHATGQILAFLNNDARPDRRWIRAAAERFASSAQIGAVASRVLDWEGERVDFIGAALTWFGMGYKPLTGELLPNTEPDVEDVLFGTGSAMFVRTDVYSELGGFDNNYFMFFEDVDLGWRLNLAGYRFAYEPESVAYHKHHASMSSFGAYKESYLLERNALFTLYKNLGEEALHEQLGATLALSVRRAIARGQLDSTQLDIRRPDTADETMPVSKNTMATVFGIDQFVTALPTLAAQRAQIQADRKVTDARIWRLFGQTDAPSFPDEGYLSGYRNLVSEFRVLEPPRSTRVIVITGDPVGDRMAGPAIRAWHMAEALSTVAEVRLISLAETSKTDSRFEVTGVRIGDNRAMSEQEQWADVIVFQGLAMALFPAIRNSGKLIVADVYDPMHLEQLEQGRELGDAQWTRQVADATGVLNEQLERADFLLCASERQRHFYLGQLAALGRVTPATYAADPDLTGLIGVVPFGTQDEPPTHTRNVLRGVIPGIETDDKLLIWGGGLYNWFDPKTLIRAVDTLNRKRGSVRLFFQGTKHPNPGVPEMGIVRESRELANELGALNSSVFFNAEWVDYNDRQNYLLEADAGVSTHYSHVETTFSFRTRILDYLWAGLPMVVTEGDHFADLIRERGLGLVVPERDPEALAAALERVLFDEEFRTDTIARVRVVAEEYRWSQVLEPLVSFVADPHAAGDRDGSAVSVPSTNRAHRAPVRHGFRRDLQLVGYYFKNGGVRVVWEKVTTRLRARR
ncbi:glycosyltransferase [Mycetocola sp. JXN-3]|uniref:glycosyltransferase n=1 Tax=Mycetocola sp. JXN-3 TaxID=2116510 RepID=UPI0021078D72|nr:glycosyltransferase [Mycetocola sp. JXN-3]